MTPVIAAVLLLHVLQTAGALSAGAWLLLPSSPHPSVSGWWHRRIVIVLLPVPPQPLHRRGAPA
jgi:hypothetical protein